LSPRRYCEWITSTYVDDEVGVDGVHLVLVTGEAMSLPSPGGLPVVVAWEGDRLGGDGPEAADLVVGRDDREALVGSVERCPLAATSLAVLLRGLPGTEAEVALGLESATYSMLQSGPEFAQWRTSTAHRAPSDATDAADTVQIDRQGAQLTIWLNRPGRHNAITSRLRDELTEALRLPLVDDSIERVVLRGRGRSFCSGGDLGEFGTFTDPASAHHVRLARSPARLLYRLRARLHAHIHGATLGGGLEWAAFAGRITAAPDTVVGLPETGLGLIPGAGGTVSVSRRIGRQRTAALALTDRRLDAHTALDWGLVDEIVDVPV